MKRSQFPKQIWYWLNKHGFKYRKMSSNWCYFEGTGRYWRFCEIDNKVHLQMGETKDTFDRWANSVEKTVPFNCKTHKEFKELLIQMK